MRDDKWQIFMVDLIDSFERELPSEAPDSIREKLSSLRNRVINKKKNAFRKSIEGEIDAFLVSTPFLKDCSGKYIVKRLEPAVDQAIDLLRRADVILKKYDQKDGA